MNYDSETVEVVFELSNRSREVASALRYLNKTACSIFGSGMRRCAMRGKSQVVTTWDNLEDAKDAQHYLTHVQRLGCLITWEEEA